MSIEAFQQQLSLLQERLSAISVSDEEYIELNYKIRVLHADVELLCMDIEDMLENKLITSLATNLSIERSGENDQLKVILHDLEEISNQLKLKFSKRGKVTLHRMIYDIIRIYCAGSFLLFAGIYLSLPIILFKELDVYLIHQKILHPSNTMACWLKNFITKSVLKISGKLASQFATVCHSFTICRSKYRSGTDRRL
jgi:hypothetical protein